MSDLLLNEPPLIVFPSLVRRLGLVEAALVQQLHYWSQRATRTHDGFVWVYKTYQDWSDEIGVSAKAARGALDRLRRDGLVVAIQNPTDLRDRTLWWRVDHDVLESGAPSDPGGGQTDPGGAPAAPAGSSNARAPQCSAETTSESTAEKRASAPEDAFPEVEAWLLHGRGATKQCKDIVSRYRNFLANSDPMAGPPLPVGVTPLHGRSRSRSGPSARDFLEAAARMGD
jgi:hypothetical protein